jgi:hypothetical protein
MYGWKYAFPRPTTDTSMDWRSQTSVFNVTSGLQETAANKTVGWAASDDFTFECFVWPVMPSDMWEQGVLMGSNGMPRDIAPDDADKRNYNVIFQKAEEVLGFKADVSIVQGIKEMYSALKSGKVDTGPKTVTVQWYRNILEAKSLLDSISLDGRII